MAAVRQVEEEIVNITPNPDSMSVLYQHRSLGINEDIESDESSFLGGPLEGKLLQEPDFEITEKPLKQEFQHLLQKNDRCTLSFFNKGVYVTLSFFVLAVIGFGLVEGIFTGIGVTSRRFFTAREATFNTSCYSGSEGMKVGCFLSRLVRVIGVFGFVGGLTNWIAVEMLFFKIPGCVGSGVIVRHYEEIRNCLKELVLRYVFDTGSLQEYMDSERSEITKVLNLDDRLRALLQPETAERLIAERLKGWKKSKEAITLFMLGVDLEKLKAFLQPRLVTLAVELSPVIAKSMCRSHGVDAVRIQQQIRSLVESKMREVSAKGIRQILKVIIRKDLSWLVIYGCVAGAAIGFVAELVSIALDDSLFVQLTT